MQPIIHASPEVRQGGAPGAGLVVPIERETRATLPTDEAALHLNRAPQTLRIWACRENGPIRPLRIGGRLAWSVADLRRLLGVA
jgi:hypothetical protein